MPATYKLTYFNITGLGEPIRFLLSYGGVEFEDKRISFEEWPSYKSQMPMEQVPILEIDGKVYHQTRAISRYLAKKFDLYGSNDLEALEIDAVVDDIEDWRVLGSKFFREEDPALKAKFKAQALERTPFFLNKFEQLAKQNSGYLGCNKLSYADTHFTVVIGFMSYFLDKDLIKDYPTLKKLTETVTSLPKIKAYIDKRPKTMF